MENQAVVHALRTAALHSGQPRRRPVGTCCRRGSASAQGTERLGHGGSASDFSHGSERVGEGWKSGQLAARSSLRSPDKGKMGLCLCVGDVCNKLTARFFYFYTAASWRRGLVEGGGLGGAGGGADGGDSHKPQVFLHFSFFASE